MTRTRKRALIPRRVYLHSGVLRYPQRDETLGLYEDRQVDVTDLLITLDSLPKDLDRTVDGEHTNYLLDGLPEQFTSYQSLNIDHADEDFVMGRFGVTRFYGLPRAEGGGQVFDMPLEEHQGVYDPCHFVYFLHDDRMVYEANGHGPRPISFASYLLDRSTPTEHPISTAIFRPMLRGEQITHFLQALDELTELELEVPRGYIQAVKDQNEILGESLESAQRVVPDAPRISVIFRSKLYQKKGGFRGFKAPVAELARVIPDAFTRLQGKAKPRGDDSGPAVPFDLLEDRLSTSIQVSLDAGRHVVSDDMYAEMISFYESVADEFAPRNGG